jgi:hypothetical protein
MNIDWCKCLLQSRCRLESINLSNEYFNNLIGVYVIWSGSDKKNIVSIGQGTLRDKLIEMQTDKKVQSYGPDLFVTWAVVPEISLKGVEAFLYRELKPLIHQNREFGSYIFVNLP